jgi:hypothetical protein
MGTFDGEPLLEDDVPIISSPFDARSRFLPALSLLRHSATWKKPQQTTVLH